MDVHFGPNAVDESSLQYKLQRKLKVFNEHNLPNRGYSLISTSSKYGIVFIGTPLSTLSVYYLKDLIDKDCDPPPYLSVRLQEKPTYISVNCDQELLATTGGQILNVYKVTDFQNENVLPCVSVNFDVNPSTFVTSLQWNPCMPDVIAVAFFDGTLLLTQLSNGDTKRVQCNARCLCWSPKGKQLVVGGSDGSLSQYKPDLSRMKSFPTPNLFNGAPAEVIAVHWISTYQFAVVYKNAADLSRPTVTIVNTPKSGQASCINYEDICYSMGSSRPWYYYLLGLTQWNLILASSSNSMEIATLGTKDSASWFQWSQNDEARPELPLLDKKQENYPVGLALDLCAIHQVPWGENETLPPMPLLHVLSHTGLLVIFNVINLNRNGIQICSPPQQLVLPETALIRFIRPISQDTQQQPLSQLQQIVTGFSDAQQKNYLTAQTIQIPQVAAVSEASVNQQSQVQQLVPIQKPVQSSSQVLQTQVQPTHVQKQEIEKIPHTPPKAASGPTDSQQYIQYHTQVFESKAHQQSNLLQEIKANLVKTEQENIGGPTDPPQHIQYQTQVFESKAHQQSSLSQEMKANELKIEQKKIATIKANQELKTMLIKEVNEFQIELYKFMLKTRDFNKLVKSDEQLIDVSSKLQSLDTEKLKKECNIEELRSAIVQLKLELVRAYAVVAVQSSSNDRNQWTQADPFSCKRLASIKKLAFYVQNQLEQAHKALDYKWNELDALKTHLNKPGVHMIRPVLDDMYQPLVKQQEILSRQQAVLRTLRNSMNEHDLGPFKPNSILRTTPFRKDRGSLSKLTKNILNMSIEPQTPKNQNKPAVTFSKLEALRDMLSNHKTVRIKPVNIELRQHLATMRASYEKMVKEKSVQNVQPAWKSEELIKDVTIKSEPETIQDKVLEVNQEMTPATVGNNTFIAPTSTPRLTSAQTFGTKAFNPGLAGVTRALFTDEPEEKVTSPKESHKDQDTRSILIELLQKRGSVDPNKYETFMGQPICSPNASQPISKNFPHEIFGQSCEKPINDIKPSTAQNQTPKQISIFTTGNKPSVVTEGDISKSENTPLSPTYEKKHLEIPAKPVFSEIKPEKPVINIPKTPLANTQNIPDIIKNPNIQVTLTKGDEKTVHARMIPQQTETVKEVKDNSSICTKNNTDNQTHSALNNEKAAADFKLADNISSAPSIFSQSVFSPTTTATATATAVMTTTDSTPSAIFTSRVSLDPAPASKESENSTSVSKIQSVLKTEMLVSTPTSPSPSSLFAAANASSPKSAPLPPSCIVTENESPEICEFPVPSPAQPDTSTANQATSVFNTSTSDGQSPTKLVLTTPSSPISKELTETTEKPVDATQSNISLFNTVPAVPQTGSVFSSTVSNANSPVFGSPNTSQTSIFGTNEANQPVSIFGKQSPTPQSVFGTQAPATTQAVPVFGMPTATSTQNASPFGTAESSLFAAASISTTSAQSQSSPGSIFSGSNTSGGSVFGGSSGNIFGGKPTFGQTNTAASVFGGGGATFGQQTPANNFWGANNTTSTFGTGFGQSAQASSIFGGAGGFSGDNQGQAFGSPTNQTSMFGGGDPNNANAGSVFGGQQQNASAFGGSATFGSNPVFGQPTSFGSLTGGFGTFNSFNKSPSSGFGGAASFGAPATFGSTSPGKVFGAASPTFGTPTQQSSTFENLANQSTLTFGNLAQQSTQATPMPSFNKSPSFTGWRG